MSRRALNNNPPITTYHGEPGFGYFGKHAGYDYGVVRWQVIAPENGVITAVYNNRPTLDGGNIVELRSDRYDHRFLHLDSINVAPGQQVTEGQVLAISGNTGNVAYHLHHDTRAKGTTWTSSYSNYVDWEQIIKQEGEEVITDQDTGLLRIGHSEIGGWDLHDTHSGKQDKLFMDTWKGHTVKEFIWAQWNAGEAYRNQREANKQKIKDLEVALANEQAKPPKEVIKEVVKIVEKPVEVIKEVPVYTHDVETKNMIKSIYDYFVGQFKTFTKYIKKG